MLAAMRAAGVDRLTERVDFPINIAVGDSLLHGKGAPGRQGEFDFGGETGAWTYRTEDVDDYIKSCHILEYGTYHVVVANPPYITVKDKAENESIRARYESCSGKYALSVPFAERIFGLAVLGTRLHWPDHRELVHEARVRQEANRGVLPECRSDACDRHVWCIHSRPRYSHRDPDRSSPFPASDSTIRAVLGIRGEPASRDPAQAGLAGNVSQSTAWQRKRVGKRCGCRTLRGILSQWRRPRVLSWTACDRRSSRLSSQSAER